MRDVVTQVATELAADALAPNQSVLPKKRRLVVDYPGQINFSPQVGQVQGCRIVHFEPDGVTRGLTDDEYDRFSDQLDEDYPVESELTAAESVNCFFRHRANLFVVKMWPVEDSLVVVYSTALDGKDLEDFHEAGAYSALVMAGIRGELGDLEESTKALRASFDEVLNRVKAKLEEKAADEQRAKADAEVAAEQVRLAKLGKLAESQGWKGRIASLEQTVRKLGGSDARGPA